MKNQSRDCVKLKVLLVIMDEFIQCWHDIVEAGVCLDCGEEVEVFIHSENDTSSSSTSRVYVQTNTDRHIADALGAVTLDQDIKTIASTNLLKNDIQIRDNVTTRQVVFAHVYSVMYSRDLPEDELFRITPTRLAIKFGLSKKSQSRAIEYISSGRIPGPGIVIVHPVNYLKEYKRENPECLVSELIKYDLIELVENVIHPVLSPLISENPCKVAVAIMHMFSDHVYEGVKPKPIMKMYSWYKLELSMVKEVTPKVKNAFETFISKK